MSERKWLAQDMRTFQVVERLVQAIAIIVLGRSIHFPVVGVSSFCVHFPTPGSFSQAVIPRSF